MPDFLELKTNKEGGARYVEITGITDWTPALRTLIKQFEKDAVDPFTRGRRIAIVIKRRDPVFVTPIFPTGGTINKVSGILTHDDTGHHPPLATLVAFTRIKDPSQILKSLKADEGTKYSDIAAVEHGISEQAYGGRGAIIATIMTHKYGAIMKGLKDVKDIKKDKLVAFTAYHSVYVGTGKGGAGDLAILQNEIQELKLLKEQTEKIEKKKTSDDLGDIRPSTIAVQLSEINQDIIKRITAYNRDKEEEDKLKDDFRTDLLEKIVEEAGNAIRSLYNKESDKEEEDTEMSKNLIDHLIRVRTYINANTTNKITNPKKAKFLTSTGKSTGTELKVEARRRSDIADLIAKEGETDDMKISDTRVLIKNEKNDDTRGSLNDRSKTGRGKRKGDPSDKPSKEPRIEKKASLIPKSKSKTTTRTFVESENTQKRGSSTEPRKKRILTIRKKRETSDSNRKPGANSNNPKKKGIDLRKRNQVRRNKRLSK